MAMIFNNYKLKLIYFPLILINYDKFYKLKNYSSKKTIQDPNYFMFLFIVNFINKYFLSVFKGKSSLFNLHF